MTSFPEPQSHGPISEVFPDVFVVQGSIRFAPLLSIARNMTIVREAGTLTLINSVRLSPQGEAALEQLGQVKHLVKLGFFHGLDDPYYRARYSPTFWAPRPQDKSIEALENGGAGPLRGAEVFCFEKGLSGEAAFILKRSDGNILITCDSVQNWVDMKGCSFFGGLMMRSFGFIEPAKVGPFWMKRNTNNHPALLKPDFDRLLGHDFAHLIAGHGAPMQGGAKDALRRSTAKVFGA